MKRILLTLSILTGGLVTNVQAQLLLGVNGGAYLANKKTAMLYSGFNPAVNFGVERLFNNSFFRTQYLDNYFKYNYEIVEVPTEMKYRPSIEYGATIGYRIDESMTFYGEVNFAQLKTQDIFVVKVDDPSPQAVQQFRYENIPIFGEEQRLNVNIGLQVGLFSENNIEIFMPFLGNFNSMKFGKNYFVINGRQHFMHQAFTNQPNYYIIKIGGAGYGGGSGLGVRYLIQDKFTLELTYNALYTKTKVLDTFNEFGLNHNVLLKIIWG